MYSTHLRIALASLKSTRVRTTLTILGVVIGVASICLVLAFVEGAKRAVSQQVGSLNGDVITIRPGKITRDPGGTITNYDFTAAIGATTLTEHDLKLVSETKGAEITTPTMLITGSVKNEGTLSQSASIVATNQQFSSVYDLEIAHGQFLEEGLNRNTAVIGHGLAIELYGTDAAIGRQITLRGHPFTVIGVTKSMNAPTNVAGFDYNGAVYVSMDAGKLFNQGIAQIQQINVKVGDEPQLKPVADAIYQRVLANHDNEEDFSVIQAEEAVQLTDSLFEVLIAAITAIASVSLIVGGIGIMNIMLVTVTERTREIGIRKAVGATNMQILSQFLIEAVVMSVAGGIIGLCAAFVTAFLISGFISIVPVLTPQIALIALAVSLAVGIIFGGFPAFKAARKHPIEALRHLQ
jgi:ABC-type antimicrobial peptide transport system permease subunit